MLWYLHMWAVFQHLKKNNSYTIIIICIVAEEILLLCVIKVQQEREKEWTTGSRTGNQTTSTWQDFQGTSIDCNYPTCYSFHCQLCSAIYIHFARKYSWTRESTWKPLSTCNITITITESSSVHTSASTTCTITINTITTIPCSNHASFSSAITSWFPS